MYFFLYGKETNTHCEEIGAKTKENKSVSAIAMYECPARLKIHSVMMSVNLGNGTYPVILMSKNKAHNVYGELWECNDGEDCHELVKMLDENYGENFSRVTVECVHEASGETVNAQCYFGNNHAFENVAKIIPSGKWVK